MELTRSGILATVAVFVVVIVCVRLGFWQLDRRDQRMALNAAIAERMDAPPIVVATPPADTTGLLHRSATARGSFDHDRSIVLGGRSHRGIPGVYVLTPLRLGDGAMLVNRGWVPAPDAATIDMAALTRPVEAEVTGVLVPFADVGLPVEDGFRTRWFRLDGDAVRAQYPYPIAPLYLQATAPSSPAGATEAIHPAPLGPPTLGAGNHLSYAVQWFSFATIFLVGWGALVIRRGGGSSGHNGVRPESPALRDRPGRVA